MGKRKTHNFREVKIWKRSRILVKQVYQLTEKYPKSELFGLTNQTRKSVVSMPSNIAEGCVRGTDAQLSHFIDVAHGSSCELETQLLLGGDLGYVPSSEIDILIQETNEIQKMMLSFKDSLGPSII
jgi:four helix bundle protein